MARVEWTRLEGNDVEAVVAMFVNRERPESVRITPSAGDGGVDILDRGGGPDGGDLVYQVKRYTGPLVSRQKADVEDSLRALTEDERWRLLNVTDWRLVTPWDPTPEADAWLQQLAESYNLTAIWHGLTYVEQLAARYPDVVDYYLHGGRSRIAEAYQAIFAVSRLEDAGQPPDVLAIASKVEGALAVLNTDPHYRYELHFGEGTLPRFGERPGLVMTSVVGHNDGRWVAVDLIARCAASSQAQPVTISGTFEVESGTEFEDALRDFSGFGTPFTSPDGAYRGTISAPGGLGGSMEQATVHAFPVAGDLGDNRELHLEALNPSGVVLGTADVVRVERSSGTDGVRVVLRELHGAFTIEDRYVLRDRSGSRNIAFGAFTNAPAAAARSALEFLLHCRPPNSIRISIRHTPPANGVLDPNMAMDWPDSVAAALADMTESVNDLVTIQEHARAVVRVPNMREVAQHQPAQWRLVARVLRGERVGRRYPPGHGLVLELGGDILPPDPHQSLTISVPLEVPVGNQTIDLGRVAATLENPTLVDRVVRDGVTYLTVTTPDRVVFYESLALEADTDEAPET